jgi:hypothetical protein
MGTIKVEVWLYGPLARYGGNASKKSYSQLELNLPTGTRMCDLLEKLVMPTEERSMTFINGTLSAMPGLQPDLDTILHDGDRVAFFHQKSMWPFHYRDGAAVTPKLAEDMRKKNRYFHNRNY